MRRALRLLCASVFGISAQVSAQGSVPSIASSARVDPSREINFASGVWPPRVYVGQQITYQIGIFLTDDLRARLRSNPQFVPPDVRSVIAYDLPSPARLGRRTEGPRAWDVHVFSRALFPVAAGAVEIAPARLTYQVPLSTSIFSREESHSSRSSVHRVAVQEPPAEGRPTGYNGAVGRLSVRASAGAPDARVGDPFVLTLTVSGVGNVGLFPRPAMTVPWGHAVAGPERVSVDSTSALITGDKHFEWVVTPRVAGSQTLPEVRYPYFNPYTERYEIAVAAPLGVRVRPGTLAAVDAPLPAEDTRLSVRRTLRPDIPAPIPASPWFWAGLAVVPMPGLVRHFRRRSRPHRVVPAHDQLKALASAAIPDLQALRRATRATLHSRVPRTRVPHGMEGPTLERTLRRSGVSLSTAKEVRRVMAELDEMAYAPGRSSAPGLAHRVLDAMQKVDEEATEAWGTASRAGGLALLLLVVGGSGLRAAQGDESATIFAEGVAAYDAGDMAEAMERFRAVGDSRQRSADAWANVGTSAWEAGDTALAVEGWQRALRLEPLASDARARLKGTPSFRDGWLGDVAPVPVNAIASLGLVAWVLGWGLLWHGGAMTRRVWWSLGVAATAGLAALVQSEQLRGAREVVIQSRGSLRDIAAMSGRPVATILPGETAHVEHAEGAWVRIRLDDGRTGWSESQSLRSLEVPSAR